MTLNAQELHEARPAIVADAKREGQFLACCSIDQNVFLFDAGLVAVNQAGGVGRLKLSRAVVDRYRETFGAVPWLLLFQVFMFVLPYVLEWWKNRNQDRPAAVG